MSTSFHITHALRQLTLVVLAVAGITLHAHASDPRLLIRENLTAGSSPQLVEMIQSEQSRWDPRFRFESALALDRVAKVVHVAEDGQVYVGGEFKVAGASVVLNHIGRFDGENWSALGGGLPNPVSAVYSHENTVFASDIVKSGNGWRSQIYRWDGNNWSTFGTPLTHEVTDMVMYRGDLYVSGIFERVAGADRASYLARWDGGEWRSVGGGPKDWVMAMEVYNDQLVIGGLFTNIAGVSRTANIAAWDGSRWSALGRGVDNAVIALTTRNGVLYTGGAFESASGVANTKYLAAWNGQRWESLGATLDDHVASISVSDQQVLVGGWFKTFRDGGIDIPAASLAKYDLNTKTWSSFGGGALYSVARETTVLSMAQHEGDVFVAGLFNRLGNVGSFSFGYMKGIQTETLSTSPVLYAPAHKGTVSMSQVPLTWTPVAGAITYTIQIGNDPEFTQYRTLGAITDTTTIVSRIDNVATYYWRVRGEFAYESGEWSDAHEFQRVTATSDVADAAVPYSFALHANYPNPFNPATTIRFELDATEAVQLSVYTVDGREVARLANEVMAAGVHNLAFDAAHLSSGVYLYRLQAGQKVATRTMTLVK